MDKYFTADQCLSNKPDGKRKCDAKKSLNNYINQLKIHFDLNEDEIIAILSSVLNSNKSKNLIKKWWQIWK